MSRPLRLRRWLLVASVALLLICAAAAGAAAWSNRSLPAAPAVLDRLDPLDKARLDEATQLRAALGDAVWPGWSAADIPLLIWNDEYSFLTGLAAAPPGWEAVADDKWNGQSYFRQAGGDPQNFVVLISGQWVASLATKWEADQFLIERFREMLPGPLSAVFPYRFLIQRTESYLGGLLHETFHAYQAQKTPARLEAAEATHALGGEYWQVEDELGNAAWRAEASLLARALTAADDSEARTLSGQFLAQRDERRAGGVPAHLVAFEQQLEWEEGLAKYVELAIWRAASVTPGYAPAPALADDPDFRAYAAFDSRWSQELTTLRLQGGQQGETRFYYTGMAQAFLLDRLMPGWQAQALNDEATVEALLRAAVEAGG